MEDRSGPWEAGPLGNFFDFVEPGHILDGNFDAQVEPLQLAGVDNRHWPMNWAADEGASRSDDAAFLRIARYRWRFAACLATSTPPR